MSDWKTAQAARDAASKRTELESFDQAISEAEGHLAQAQEFEGWAATSMADIERQISAIAPAYAAGMEMIQLRQPNEAGTAELSRLYGIRGALEREIAEHRAAKTITVPGTWGRTITRCLLSVSDMSRRLHHLQTVRDRVAEELSELEAKCTPGQLVQAGSPAPDYTQYQKRAEELRNGRAVVRGGAS